LLLEPSRPKPQGFAHRLELTYTFVFSRPSVAQEDHHDETSRCVVAVTAAGEERVRLHQLERIVVEERGTGPAVVFVHGLGGNLNLWAGWLPALQAYRCIRIDLPGCGLSAPPAQPLGVAWLADRVVALCEGLGLREAHWVGHSMGTLICQRVAVQEPTRVKSLALFGPLSVPPQASRRALAQRAQQAREGGLEALHSIAETLAQATLSASTRRDEPLIVAFVHELIRRNDPHAYAQHCEALASAQEEAIETIEAPTLLVTGDEDAVTPPQMMQSLATRLSSSVLVQHHVLRGCGHWTPLERRADCLKLWSEFLRVSHRARRQTRIGSTV